MSLERVQCLSFVSFILTDGVVLVDSDYIKDRKVFGHVLAAFRYGREDLDVLGLTFRKDLYLASSQIFPQESTNKRSPTRLQVSRTKHSLVILLPPYLLTECLSGAGLTVYGGAPHSIDRKAGELRCSRASSTLVGHQIRWFYPWQEIAYLDAD